MLNYVQTPERTTVSVFPVQHQSHTGLPLTPTPLADVPLSSSLAITPEESREQGRRAGRAEATEMLAQAELAKGAPLTKSEVLACYEARFFEQMKQDYREEPARSFADGWWPGFVEVCIQARDAAPEPTTMIEPEPVGLEPEPVAGTVNFRQAQIETDDMEEFTKGIECGQACYVEDGLPLTTQSLFTLFAGAIDADDPQAYNIGFIIGHVDALCRNRKLAPCGFLAGPKKAPKAKKKRTKRATRKK
jgi:hypothetical protein